MGKTSGLFVGMTFYVLTSSLARVGEMGFILLLTHQTSSFQMFSNLG